MTEDRARSNTTVSRREVLAALVSAAALPLLSACGRSGEPMPTRSNEASALTLLDELAENLIA
jgi:hypothetical protein